MINLQLSEDHLRVEPGSAATLTVSVRNAGEQTDRYEMDLAGLDTEWLAVPVPTFVVGPGEERQEKILIKPPRSAESKAGAYPFTVKVRSLETGEGSEAPAVLEIGSFQLISLEIDPKREAASYFSKTAPFSVMAINLGNTEQNLQLFADDPEDGCTYEFAQERVQLAPGQQKQVSLQVQPTHFPVVGSTRLFGFAVSARNVENPHIFANAQAQVERKAMFTPTFLIAALLIIGLGTLWYAMRPAPASMESFSASQTESVKDGTEVTLQWSSSNAKKVTIESGDGRSWDGLPPQGKLPITMRYRSLIKTASGVQAPPESITFVAWAVNDLGRSKEHVQLDVQVLPPEVILLPKIESFSVSPKSILLGGSVTLRFKVLNAARIELEQLNKPLGINAETYEYKPEQAGEQELTLAAYNIKNEVVRETRRFTVQEKSTASVLVFRALVDGKPLLDQEVEPLAVVTLEWHVTGAARREIQPGVGPLEAERGTAEVTPDKTTQFLLTAVDDKGRSVVQKVTVKVKEPALPSDGSHPR